MAPGHARIPRGSRPGARRANEVVGGARPPTFSDLPSLPYILPIVKETLLWSLTLPFDVPDGSSADDWYEGVFIPKGTICLQNMRVINSEDGHVWRQRGAVQPGEVSRRESSGQGARPQGGGLHVVWDWAAHIPWEILYIVE